MMTVSYPNADPATGLTFVAAWPIRDAARSFARLTVEAAADIDRLAAATGARIVGDVHWDVHGTLLCASAAATSLDAGGTTVNPTTSLDARRLAVWWLTHRELLGPAEIADRLGISDAAVTQARGFHPATQTGARTYRGNAASVALRAKVAAHINS